MVQGLKSAGYLLSGLFLLMLVVRFTAYSQQPFWDILRPWEFIMVFDLIPVEGFNTDADGQYIHSDRRKGICIVVNILMISVIFWATSMLTATKTRRLAQGAAFWFIALWYVYMVIGSMLGGP